MDRLFRISFLLAIVVTLMIAGCSNDSSTTSESGGNGGDDTATATVQSDGTGELVYATDSMGSDDFYFLGGLPPAWIQLTNDRLIRYSYDDEPEGFYPMLAERFEFAPDYSSLDLYLRRGVQWQDERGEFTAEDVKYTMDLQADESAGSWQAWWWAPIDQGGFISDVEVVDPYHVRFHFDAPPYPAWLGDFATAFMGVVCKSYVEEVGLDKAIREPIGTGPWQLIDHVPGSYMKFERFDEYWGPKPQFKYLTVRNVPEKESQLAMLQTGEADIVGISPDQLSEVQANGLDTFQIPEASGEYILFGGQLLASDPNFDPSVPWAAHTDESADSEWNQRALKVREALNLAINREAIRSKIMQGACTPMTTYMWPPSMAGYKAEWADISYDPDQAKQLLTEAGYPNGFERPITMYVDSGNTFAGPTGKEVALAVANDLEAVGLKVDRQLIDANAFSDLWYSGHQDAWGMSAMALEVFPDPTTMWPWLLFSGSGTHGAFADPAFDAIIDEYNQSMTMSEDERIEIAQRGQDYMYNNSLFAPIAFTSRVYALGKRVSSVTGYERYIDYAEPGINFSEVILAK